MPGSIWRSAHPDATHRHHRPDRLRQVDRRELARRARRVCASSTPTMSRGSCWRPGRAEVEAVYARFGEALRRPDGKLDRAALGPHRVRRRRRLCATSRRSSIRPCAHASSTRSSGRGVRRPSRRDRGDQARGRGPRRALRRGLAGHLRARHAEGAPARAGAGSGRRGCPDRRAGRSGWTRAPGLGAGATAPTARPRRFARRLSAGPVGRAGRPALVELGAGPG